MNRIFLWSYENVYLEFCRKIFVPQNQEGNLMTEEKNEEIAVIEINEEFMKKKFGPVSRFSTK